MTCHIHAPLLANSESKMKKHVSNFILLSDTLEKIRDRSDVLHPVTK